jgi:hypothetical protein
MTKPVRTKLTVGVVEGCEAYRELAEATGIAYERALSTDQELGDGQGNCWVVAACAKGAANALGIKATVCVGKVRDAVTGEFKYNGADHYWLSVGAIIVDSPSPDMVLVHRHGQPADVRYIRHIRKVRGLDPIVAVAEKLARRLIQDRC